MYSRIHFGKELKQKLKETTEACEIGNWAYTVYLENIKYITTYDNEFGNLLLILNHMEDGPEFELSFDRLEEIADALIAGKKDINIDY